MDARGSEFPHGWSSLQNSDAPHGRLVVHQTVDKRGIVGIVGDAEYGVLAVVIFQVPRGGLCRTRKSIQVSWLPC